MSKSGTRPVHPGEVLREEYLTPLGTGHDQNLARAFAPDDKT